MRYLTEDILSSIRLSGYIPQSDVTFSDDDLIFLANEELQNTIVPIIMSVRENYFLSDYLETITSAKYKYYMPQRAIGNQLRNLMYVQDASQPLSFYPMNKIELNDIIARGLSNGTTDQYFVQADQVVLTGIPTTSSAALRWYFYRRPSQLIATSSCAKVTAISSASGTTTFTVDTDLTASLSVGDLIDVQTGKSPFNGRFDDVEITAITSTTIACATDDVEDESGSVSVVVGDYLCPAGYSNIPQIPSEFAVILSEMTVGRCLKGMGAKDNYQIVEAEVSKKVQGALKLIANRIEDKPQVIKDQMGLSNLINSGWQTSPWRR